MKKNITLAIVSGKRDSLFLVKAKRFPPPIFNINSEMKILLNEFHFVIQTKLFD